MSDSRRSGAGLGVLAVGALVVCCAGPALISAGVLAAVGTWLRNALVIAGAALLACGALVYALYRSRGGAATGPDPDAAARDRTQA